MSCFISYFLLFCLFCWLFFVSLFVFCAVLRFLVQQLLSVVIVFCFSLFLLIFSSCFCSGIWYWLHMLFSYTLLSRSSCHISDWLFTAAGTFLLQWLCDFYHFYSCLPFISLRLYLSFHRSLTISTGLTPSTGRYLSTGLYYWSLTLSTHSISFYPFD